MHLRWALKQMPLCCQPRHKQHFGGVCPSVQVYAGICKSPEVKSRVHACPSQPYRTLIYFLDSHGWNTKASLCCTSAGLTQEREKCRCMKGWWGCVLPQLAPGRHFGKMPFTPIYLNNPSVFLRFLIQPNSVCWLYVGKIHGGSAYPGRNTMKSSLSGGWAACQPR